MACVKEWRPAEGESHEESSVEDEHCRTQPKGVLGVCSQRPCCCLQCEPPAKFPVTTGEEKIVFVFQMESKPFIFSYFPSRRVVEEFCFGVYSSLFIVGMFFQS